MSTPANRFPPIKPSRSDRRHDVPLAWCGWELPIPSALRPFSIEGTWEDGRITLGTGSDANLDVEWCRPDPKLFDVDQWLDDRALVFNAPSVSDGPTNDSFEKARLFSDLETDDGTTQDVWCGFSEEAGLALEIGVTKNLDAHLRDIVMTTGVPNLSAVGAGRPTHWSLGDDGFDSPAGYTMNAFSYESGELRMDLVNTDREALILRHAYPPMIAMAQSGATAEKAAGPFGEHRRLKSWDLSASVQMVLRSGGDTSRKPKTVGGLSCPPLWNTRRPVK